MTDRENCDRLHAFADDELDAEAHRKFREHLAECPRCRSALDEIQELKYLVAVIKTPPKSRPR